MSKLLTFIHRLRRYRGFTLVELMVVIVIISILAFGSLGLVNFIFDANIRSSQTLDQQTTAQDSFAFLSSRLGAAQKPVGAANDSGQRINNVSIAGDQLIFNTGGRCTRIWYAAWAEQIRTRISDSCNDQAVKPVRGPNQVASNPIPGNDYIASSESDPDYDSALDTPFGADGSGAGHSGIFSIADGIVSARPTNADASVYPDDPLQVFRYKDFDYKEITTIDSEANSSSSNTWYDDLSNRNDIDAVIVSEYILPISASGLARIASHAYQQTITLEQVGGGGGSCSATQGIVLDHVRVDGEATGVWRALAGSASETVRRADAGDYLESADINTQEAWIKFNGEVAVQPNSGVVDGWKLKIELLRNGTPVISGGDGRYSYTFTEKKIIPSDGIVSGPFLGSFSIPTESDEPSSTVYSLRVEITNDGPDTLYYSTARSKMFLDYAVVGKNTP